MSDSVEAFVAAVVSSINDSNISVATSSNGKEIRVPLQPPKRVIGRSKRSAAEVLRVLPREDGETDGEDGVDNMDDLTHLHE